MEYYLNKAAEINLLERMQESPELKAQYAEEIRYQGHCYSLYQVYSRSLSGKERLLTFFKCLAKTVLSLGKFLFSRDFLDQWQSVFSKKHIHVFYLLKEDEPKVQLANSEPKKEEVAAAIPANTHEEPKNGATEGSPGQGNPEGITKLRVLAGIAEVVDKQTEDHQNKIPVINSESKEEIPNPKILFSSLLKRLPVEAGLNPSLLEQNERTLLADFVQKWQKLVDKPDFWNVSGLAQLLSVEEKDLQDLLFRLQIFTHVPLLSVTLDWLFKSIDDVVQNKQRATMHWSVKMLWNPGIIVLGKENRFPNGMDKPSWKLADLSMFLAVKEEALLRFFADKNMKPNADGVYLSVEIHKALKAASNSEINTILEANRTQKGSIRFATA